VINILQIKDNNRGGLTVVVYDKEFKRRQTLTDIPTSFPEAIKEIKDRLRLWLPYRETKLCLAIATIRPSR